MLLALVVLCGLPGQLDADTIQLKNGRRLTGKIVKRTINHVVLDVGSGKVTLSLAEIDSIEFGDAAAPMQASHGVAEPVQGTRKSPPRVAIADDAVLLDDALGLLLDASTIPSVGEGALSQPRLTTQDLLTLAEELLPAIAQVRGLQPRAPIAKRVADKTTIRRAIQEQLARQYSQQELANKGKAMIALGLLPPSVNLQEAIVQLYTHQLAGMYDPRQDVLYLADWLPATIQAGTVAHELVHALQDQHFDLARYLDEAKGDSEAETARQAFIEGEAVAVTLDYQLREQGLSFESLGDLSGWIGLLVEALKQSDPNLAAAPPFLEALMVFPYIHGLTFLQAVRQRYSWKEVGRLYQDPPRSTEQIMHPEKYLTQRDDPATVQLADLKGLLGPSWVRIDEDAVGEFAIGFLLRQHLDGGVAALSSEGWDGDRYQLYEEPATQQRCLVWLSVWDSVEDAQEFTQAYQQVMAAKYPGVQSAENRLERRQATVLIVENAPHERPESLVSQVWQTAGGAAER